jgi:hypothetical protein
MTGASFPRLGHDAERERGRSDSTGPVAKKIRGHEKYSVCTPPKMSPTAEPPIAMPPRPRST